PSPTRKPNDGPSFVGEVVYAPDGRSIVTVSSGPDRVWDASTGRIRRTIAAGGHGMAMSAAFSPDSGVLVLGRLDGSVTVQDAVTGNPLCTFTGHRDAVDGIVYAPDGRTLATASLDGTARIWDAASGRTLHELIGSGAALRAVAYSPDGATLVTVAGNGATTLWDVASGLSRRVLAGPVSPTDRMTYVVAFAPDGRTVVRGGDSGGVVSWDISANGGQHLVHDAGPVYGLAFSPDGRVLVYTTGDDTVHLVDPSTGDQVRSFTAGSTTTVDGVAFSPDGTRFATLGGLEGNLKTWTR
ncbi:MAG: WD40 repeat domain-containing protein, partial [Kineosporiaceae bacterium]